MAKDKINKIILSFIGVLSIFAGIGTVLWLCTIGLVILVYCSQMEQSSSPFLTLVVGVPFGFFFAWVGIGILRRQPWSRKFLMVFWLIISIFAAGSVLLSFKELINNNQFWFEAFLTPFWFSVVGILHVIFLSRNSVKNLFKHS